MQLPYNWYASLKGWPGALDNLVQCEMLGKRIAAFQGHLQPAPEHIFRAFELCPLKDTRVVILGQDPYPTRADGLAFSQPGSTIPSSLRYIFKALELEGFGKRTNPNLQDWADQGVLLLNTSLTNETGKTGAHLSWGWGKFTGWAVRQVLESNQPRVFMLWGKHAKELFRKVFDDPQQILPAKSVSLSILMSCHPQYMGYSGEKGDFYEAQHFTKANEWLKTWGQSPIKWV
jgi:uracil-DNA glycosylase